MFSLSICPQVFQTVIARAKSSSGSGGSTQSAPLNLPIPPTWIEGSVGLLAQGAEAVQKNFGPWSLEDLTIGLAVMAKV